MWTYWVWTWLSFLKARYLSYYGWHRKQVSSQRRQRCLIFLIKTNEKRWRTYAFQHRGWIIRKLKQWNSSHIKVWRLNQKRKLWHCSYCNWKTTKCWRIEPKRSWDRVWYKVRSPCESISVDNKRECVCCWRLLLIVSIHSQLWHSCQVCDKKCFISR